MPSLTIVTSVLNGMPYVGEMLDSLPDTSDLPFEHVIVDGGSQDGTLEYLLERQQPHQVLQPAPGTSIYEAWNLGVGLATGDLIWFVNADDVVDREAAIRLHEMAQRQPDFDIVCAAADAFAEKAPEAAAAAVPRAIFTYNRQATVGPQLETFLFGAPIINAKWFRRKLFGRAGVFDPTFRMAGDRDWLLRVLLLGDDVHWRIGGDRIYRYRVHAGSLTLSGAPDRRTAIAKEHVSIADRLLDFGTVSSPMRRAVRRWRAREAAILLWTHLKSGDLGRFALGIRQALQRDVFFIARLPAGQSWCRRYAAEITCRDGGTPALTQRTWC